MASEGPPLALVVNPAATRSRRGLTTHAVLALGPLGLAEVSETRGPGDAAHLAAAAAAAGAEVVVTIGGDGTAAEAAGALAGTGCALAPLPAGSTNVFARAIGWPRQGETALEALVGALAAGAATREVRMGRLALDGEWRAFTVNMGVGLDGEAVRTVERHPRLKHRLRHAAFAGAVAVSAVRLARHPVVLAVSVDDDEPLTMSTLSVAVGSPYAYLGRRRLELVPGADFAGGLHWTGLERPHVRDVATGIAGGLSGGRHVHRRHIHHGEAAVGIGILASRPVAVQADGEPLGRHREVQVGVGDALRVLLPPAPPLK